MPESSRSLVLLPLPFVLLLAVFLSLAPGLPGAETGVRSAVAEEEKEDGEEDDGTEPGDDLGDKNLPFAEQLNRALDHGVDWVRGYPKHFKMSGTEGIRGAHFGLIKGTRFYGGGKGRAYQHPAGATALALYTLLKCGAKPDEKVVVEGFNWLREMHRITDDPKTKEWDAAPIDNRRRTWNHTLAASSYELSMMILALTAKYDAYKKTSASRTALRKGKLKIKDKFDRLWLQQMVTALLARRGQPVDQKMDVNQIVIKKLGDPLKYKQDYPVPSSYDSTREEMLGWRYNVPKIDLIVTRGKSKESWIRGGKHPPNANQDMSSTNLAALALFSAQRFALKIPATVWKDILELTLKHQEESGPELERFVPGYVSDRYGGKPKDHARGFMYIKGSKDHTEGKATRSMTACGVANLLIAREALARDKKTRKEFMESGQLKKIDQAVWDGLAWLAVNWSTFQNRGSSYGYHIYHLYCVERAMDILGKELIHDKAWYKPGALAILKRQKRARVQIKEEKGTRNAPGVFWKTGDTHEPKDLLDTCFALLYLKRATKGLTPAPVITDGEGAPTDGR